MGNKKPNKRQFVQGFMLVQDTWNGITAVIPFESEWEIKNRTNGSLFRVSCLARIPGMGSRQ